MVEEDICGLTRVVIWMGSLVTAALLIGVPQADAGRPLVTDDAYPVELGERGGRIRHRVGNHNKFL